MIYTLPDGHRLKLENVLRVSQVRDLGSDSGSIGYSKMAFTIHLTKHEELEITEQYHYSDWAEAKRKLIQTREELINKWKEVGGYNTED